MKFKIINGRVFDPTQKLDNKKQDLFFWSEGSIAVGKRADFVVLEKNPMKVDPLDLADVAVLETFSRGKSIFKKQ